MVEKKTHVNQAQIIRGATFINYIALASVLFIILYILVLIIFVAINNGYEYLIWKSIKSVIDG